MHDNAIAGQSVERLAALRWVVCGRDDAPEFITILRLIYVIGRRRGMLSRL